MMIAVLSDPKCGSNLGQIGARTGRLEQCIEVSDVLGMLVQTNTATSWVASGEWANRMFTML